MSDLPSAILADGSTGTVSCTFSGADEGGALKSGTDELSCLPHEVISRPADIQAVKNLVISGRFGFICRSRRCSSGRIWLYGIATGIRSGTVEGRSRSEEHTSELQSRENFVCR